MGAGHRAEPVQPAWWYSLGEARSRAHDYANAIPAFERAAALGAPLMGGYYAVYEVARCYALAGDTERGVEALQRAFGLGFPDVRQAIRDPDLAALRRDARVIEMLGMQDVSAMSRDDGWRYDLTIFAREAHRKGFNTHLSVNRPVTREEFDAKVRDIRDAVPRLSDGQLVLEFIKLARFLEDGHSEVLWDFGDNPLLQPTLPLAFFWFDEGLFVTATDRNIAISWARRSCRSTTVPCKTCSTPPHRISTWTEATRWSSKPRRRTPYAR